MAAAVLVKRGKLIERYRLITVSRRGAEVARQYRGKSVMFGKRFKLGREEHRSRSPRIKPAHA